MGIANHFRVITALTLAIISNLTYATNPGFFIGANLSYNDIVSGGSKLNYNSTGAGFTVGYNFNPTPKFLVGLELGANYLGNIGQGNVNVFASNALLSGTIIISNLVDTSLKVGISQEYLSKDHLFHFYATSNLAPTLGYSLSFQLNQHLDLSLEYTHIFGQSLKAAINHPNGNAFSYNNYSLHLNYYFSRKHEQIEVLMVPVDLDNIIWSAE